ncbi:MAG: arylsulfatase [Alphaproteobacteria bacterium]
MILSSTAIAAEKPNILILWGDDIGMWNISAYHRGMMGGETPNIDRIAKEGMLFTDHYAQASSTAGRAAFITGQYPMRTGLSTVGVPGSPIGITDSTPTIADMLKDQGYVTGQFGKNHLGDLDAMLPTMHGFDEFYGILYHLNAGQYPEQYDYPKDPKYIDIIKTRGIVSSKSDGKGGQTVEDLGPWGAEVQKNLDADVLEKSMDFINRSVEADKPFFVWHNFTRMHYQTHLNDEWNGKTGYGLYADGMAEMDHYVGVLLKQLEDLGQLDNTIIMFATDNGAASNSWPDGGNQPFHGEKGAGGWEGGFRVPVVVKWKDHIPENQYTGEFMTMEDWMPTLLSWAGDKTAKEDLLTGRQYNGKDFKVHLDGYDQSDLVLNNGKSVRKEFYYFTETTLHGMRFEDWKFLFVDQEKWMQAPQLALSTPIVINLKLDPFERMLEARGYDEWAENRAYMFGPAGQQMASFLATFKEYPPAQESMNVKFADMADKMMNQSANLSN